MAELKNPEYSNTRAVFIEALKDLTVPNRGVTLDDWPQFNQITGGLRPKEFTILCGATGTGKTTLLANMSAQLLKQGVRHFVMSVENGRIDFMQKILSLLSGEDLTVLDSISRDKAMEIATQVIPSISPEIVQFSHYEDRISLEQLEHDLEFMVTKRGCQVAFIDNLNFFLEVTRSNDTLIEMDRVIHSLIMFCKKHPVHLVMVMHPRKTENTRVISEFDIKGSSTSVQEAQNVFLFNRPTAEEVGENGTRHRTDRDLTFQKMRRRGFNTGRTLCFKLNRLRYVEDGSTQFC